MLLPMTVTIIMTTVFNKNINNKSIIIVLVSKLFTYHNDENDKDAGIKYQIHSSEKGSR